MRRTTLLPALLLLPMSLGPGAPATEKKPVTDTYFGTEVRDDYRWLEDWNDAVGTGLEPGAERGSPRRPRRAAAPRRHPAARGPDRQVSLPGVPVPDRPGRDGVRDQERAAETAALPRRARLRRRPCVRARPRRPERDGCQRHDRDRLLRALARRTPGRRLPLRGRQRGRRRARLRRGFGARPAGQRAARQRRHGRRRRRLERRRVGFLLHALSAPGRARAGRHGFLPAGLVPQARHRERGGHLRARPGLSADRGDDARRLGRRALPARHGQERRRRGGGAVPARHLGIVVDRRDIRRSRHRGPVRAGRCALPALVQGLAARQDPAPFPRIVGPGGRADRRRRRPGSHRRLLRDEGPDLRGGSRGRALVAAGPHA